MTATFMQLDHRHASLSGQRPEPAVHLVSVDRLHRRPSSTTSQPYPPRTSTRRRTCCHIPVDHDVSSFASALHIEVSVRSDIVWL